MALTKFVLTAACGVVLAACGGGGAATAPASVVLPQSQAGQAQAPIGTAGVFDVNYGQFSGTYTFLDNGEFYGLHFVSGTVLAGHPHGLLKKQDSLNSP